MKIPKNTKKPSLISLPKKVILTFLIFSFLFLPFHKTQAALWPGIDPNIKQMLENIQKRIEGIALSILKQEAMKMIDRQIDKLVGGGSGGSSKSVAFITDWRKFLIKEPLDKTKVYINDYLSQVTSGRGSNSNYSSNSNDWSIRYISEGFIKTSGDSKVAGITDGFSAKSILDILGKSGGGSYASQLVSMAKKQTSEKKEPQFNYPGDPTQMFKGGTFKLFSLYLSGINNPWAFSINAQEKYKEKEAEEKKVAETKAVAYQGFKGTESKPKNEKDGWSCSKGSDGNDWCFKHLGTTKTSNSPDPPIKTPGSVVKDMVSNVKDIGNKILATAQHPEEIITAIVSQMMTKLIQQGIGEVEKVIDKETSKLRGLTSGMGGSGSGGGSNGQGGECQGRPNGTKCSRGTCQNGACK